MTDRQLAVYLGIIDYPNWPEMLERYAPAGSSKRATYERMAGLETEIELWQNGLGAKPRGVLIDGARTPAQAKGRVQRLLNRAKEAFR